MDPQKLLEKLHRLNPDEAVALVISALCGEIAALQERVEKLEQKEK
jgi:hypothetical protein